MKEAGKAVLSEAMPNEALSDRLPKQREGLVSSSRTRSLSELIQGDGGQATQSLSRQRHLEWYVIQVQSGQERRMCRLIQASCAEYNDIAEEGDSFFLDECFAPRFRSQKKWRGEWRDVERPLMPGYLIAVVDEPDRLVQRLRTIPDLCRMVKPGETYLPLTEYERSWVDAYTEKGDRVVPMSFGHRDGDGVTVTQGPLKGREGQIVKVDRSNSLAHLEFHVGQIRIKTTVGLGIVPGDAHTSE